MHDHRQLDALLARIPALETCRADIWRAFELMRDSFQSGGKLLLCGNGGSAADAEHWAGELLKGFCSKRPIGGDSGLREELAGKLQGGLPTIPLTGFVSLGTAFANDVDATMIYAQLVWALGKPGDVLVGISTSGNAANVGAAMETARAKGLRTVGLTGATGGKLKPLAEVCICAPERETFLIQELHLPIYHCLCFMLEEEFFC